MTSYSFISVQATLSGPGGSVPLGYGSGTAEDGAIETDMTEAKNTMTVGCDGTIMHSLHASDGGRMTIRLLKTSPANAALNAMYNLQKSDATLWGQNTLVASDTARGDVLTGTVMAFDKQSPVKYGKDGGDNEWNFVGNIEEILGTGTPAAGGGV